MTARKYVLTKIAAGDYLLPSNDGSRVFRLTLIDGGEFHNMWHVHEWTGSREAVDTSWGAPWDFVGAEKTRAAAIREAMRLGGTA